jgi:hypothetical protein
VAEVDDATLGRLLRFGHSTVGFHGHFWLSPATGEVRLVMPDIPSLFVNSSVDQFASTMRLFRRFEREVTTGDADDCESAVAQIRDELKRLDEPAAHPDSYWGSIGYDMAAGYYSDNPDF